MTVLEDQIKLFHTSNTLVNADLDAIESRFAVDLGRGQSESQDEQEYYLQFEAAQRALAARMARHYELFFCLENSIRDLVRETLSVVDGADWWETKVPTAVKDNVSKNLERERAAAVTLRSTELIDYTTFGELGQIILANWDDFGDTLNSRKGVERVIAGLNLLRAPIAHCCPLAEDEVIRLQLSLRDWFRLME